MKTLRVSLIGALLSISLLAGPVRVSFDGTAHNLPEPTCGSEGKCPDIPLTCFLAPNGQWVCVGVPQ